MKISELHKAAAAVQPTKQPESAEVMEEMTSIAPEATTAPAPRFDDDALMAQLKSEAEIARDAGLHGHLRSLRKIFRHD